MGKFAGFLKSAKKIAGFGMNVLDKVNNIYKGVKPFIDPLVEAVPYGNYINKGLNIGSKFIDKVKPITDNFLNDTDRKQVKKISDNIERYGGNIAQKALNNYLDEQDNIFDNRGDYSLNDYGDSIFSSPLN